MEPKYAKKKSHLFSVDILIEDATNGKALEKLLHVLNNPLIRDYRVVKGLELGTAIEAALQVHEKETADAAAQKIAEAVMETKTESKIRARADTRVEAKVGAKAETKVETKTEENVKQQDTNPTAVNPEHLTYLAELITDYQQKGTLVRLSIIKGKGVKLSLPCRVLNFDAASENLSVYHVDEKKVYLIKLNEIDEITAS
jgi:Fe-S cluster assembly iron-binding protein IscA